MASLGIRVKLMLLRSPNLNKNTNSKKETCGYWNQNVFCYKTQDMAQVVQKFKGQPWSQTLIFIAWFPQSTFETWEVFILTDERAKSQSLSDIAKAIQASSWQSNLGLFSFKAFTTPSRPENAKSMLERSQGTRQPDGMQELAVHPHGVNTRPGVKSAAPEGHRPGARGLCSLPYISPAVRGNQSANHNTRHSVKTPR